MLGFTMSEFWKNYLLNLSSGFKKYNSDVNGFDIQHILYYAGTFGRAGLPIPQELDYMKLYLIYLQSAVTINN